MERELKARQQAETVPARHYRPRRRCMVPLAEQDSIVELYQDEGVSMKEVARRHRVSAALVSKLVREARRMPEKKRAQKEKQALEARRREAICKTARALQDQGRPLASCQ